MNSRILGAAAIAALLAAAGSAVAAGRSFEDGEIVGVVSAANQGELDAAKLAADKSRNPEILKFAEHMERDHGDARLKLAAAAEKAGLTPSDTDLSGELARHGSEEASRLNAADGADFDRAYADAQVADHSMLLKELDDELLPSVKDADLSAFLHKVRATVAHHLALAKRLQAAVKSK